MNPSRNVLSGEQHEERLCEGGHPAGSNGVQNAHVGVLTAHASILRGPNRYREKSCVFKGIFETG